MGAFIEKKNRQVIPRWRTFGTTAILGELDVWPSSPPERQNTDDSLGAKISDWQAHRTIWHASDLLGAAVALGREREVVDAAQFVLNSELPTPRVAKLVAASIVAPQSRLADLIPFSPGNDTVEIYKAIHDLRRQQGDQPHNPILWVDLALAYTILGLSEQADRAISVAIARGANNRFVLRSAARFYIHSGDPDKAHRLLVNAESTPTDPWLIAAELAVAGAAGRGPVSFKGARGALSDSSLRPRDLTELAGALGTLEMENGKAGSARKLFKLALTAPNENAVAQAEWASEHLRGLSVDVAKFSTPRLFEARAWDAFSKGDWSAVLRESRQWLSDQPFSSRPAMLAAYISLEIFENHEEADHILESSLISNPTDAILLNDLAYSYARQGRLLEAKRLLNRIDEPGLNDSTRILVLATKGLCEFRGGRPEQGRALYLQAIDLASKLRYRKHKAMAAINLAREEMLVRSAYAVEALQRARKESSDFPSNDVLLVLGRLNSAEHSGIQMFSDPWDQPVRTR